MKRAIVIMLAILVISLAYGLMRKESLAPTVAFTVPKGGEMWAVGSTQSITWTKTGIPDNYKVAIGIRRIPPPPLQTEGQEFDPIIFTDLPNTGSTTWAIADMYPEGNYVLTLTAYKAVPVENPITAESAVFHISHPALTEALYPLYSGAVWGKPLPEEVVIGSATYRGVSVTSQAVTGTMDPGSIFTPFEKYYDKKLKALGYEVANELAAGGHVGGQTGYRKGSETVLTRFKILYHKTPADAPSECPCDVTLSLFSAKQ